MENINNFDSRIEFRIDSKSKNKFRKFCSDNNLTSSDAGRDALLMYLNVRSTINVILSDVKDDSIFVWLKKTYKKLPADYKTIFEETLGIEEEKLIQKTPDQLLSRINIITERGEIAFKLRKNKLTRGL